MKNSIIVQVFLFLTLIVSPLATAKCDFEKYDKPIYSKIVNTSGFDSNLNVWVLSKDRLEKSDISHSNEPYSIYESLFNAYQKDTLEGMLFYNTEVIYKYSFTGGSRRIIKAEFPESTNLDVFFIEINNNNGDYLMKTLITSSIGFDELTSLKKALINKSEDIFDVCK
ncbi:hypothetical protein EU508_17175 [Pseudoalteromonas fuliginea]|uniref:DUF4252 domain-containing protein n=1 Tax=Pseudoalteromonas fuliginea TaxID=1872678 RepID=A0AB73BD44_9GAMM|nr:hypothetical protein [Pseudoalteromonas fuliginea]KAA1157459.1 hypothetical protein EU508_17175 [Pseudoalteromonas fuliginea]